MPLNSIFWGLFMAGKPSTAPPSMLQSWLDYRKDVYGHSRADVLREINKELNRSYPNDYVYRWLQFERAVPDIVVNNFIYPELHLVLEYLFKKYGWDPSGIDFVKLSELIRPTTKQ